MSLAPLKVREDVPLVAALMGVTDGLEVVAIPQIDVSAVKDLIEINDTEVALSYQQDVYLIHRQVRCEVPVTWIGVYRKSFEIDSDRPGNYYGAGVWLHRSTTQPTGKRIVALLSHLQRNVQALAMSDERLTKRLATIRNQVDLGPVEQRMEEISSTLGRKNAALAGQAVIAEARGYIDASNLQHYGISLQWLLDCALADGPLFGEFSRVVIGCHPGAFAEGARSSAPLTPWDLRNRPAKAATPEAKPAAKTGATSHASQKPALSGVSSGKQDACYEAIVQERLRAQEASSVPVTQSPKPIELEPRSHEMHLPSRQSHRTSRGRRRQRASPLRTAVTVLQVCAALLALILFAIVGLWRSLTELGTR